MCDMYDQLSEPQRLAIGAVVLTLVMAFSVGVVVLIVYGVVSFFFA